MIPQRAYRAFLIVSAISGVALALVAVLTQRPASPLPTFLFATVIFAILTLVALAIVWPWLVRWTRLPTPSAAFAFGTFAAVVVSLAVFWRITDGMAFTGAGPQSDYSTGPLVACFGTWVAATALMFAGLSLWRRRR